MTISMILFMLTLVSIVALAGIYGQRDERMGALALVLAAAATPLAMSHSFARAEMGVVLVDFGLFLALASISLRSRSFWPMWASGFQLCALAVHMAAARLHHMLPAVYAESLVIWSYLVMLAVLGGILFEARPRYGRG
ncbi:hypothetical protein [Sandaracinobacteroides hominis]|uniref:hypothetical protein n=1 Tax=Sandaracinobacteroides hominis TaxID=2780086 RepID=UPI0018F72332|nr:hypothetical protein [Sandaracinobacteroides hominis]